MADLKYKATPEADDRIRLAYDEWIRGKDRRAIKRCATALGWSRSAVCRRAKYLGLSRAKKNRWSEAEEELLEQWAHLGPKAICKRLRAAGYRRSETAVILRRSRLGVRRRAEGWTPYELAQLIGFDQSVVSRWIRRGWLAATPRETMRTVAQRGDSYWITRESVRRFLVQHPEEIDQRKVDFEWVVYVLVDEVMS